VKPLKTAGLVVYSIVAVSAVLTVIAHLWRVQSDLARERRRGAAFQNAPNA
jgi:hypothetical protein